MNATQERCRCKECGNAIQAGVEIDICSNRRCLARRCKIVEEPNFGLVLEYIDPVTGFKRGALMEASRPIEAELEAHTHGLTVEYGID